MRANLTRSQKKLEAKECRRHKGAAEMMSSGSRVETETAEVNLLLKSGTIGLRFLDIISITLSKEIYLCFGLLC